VRDNKIIEKIPSNPIYRKYKDLIDVYKSIRMSKNITQEQLEKKLKGQIKQETMSQWENYKTTPNLVNFILVLHELGYSINILPNNLDLSTLVKQSINKD